MKKSMIILILSLLFLLCSCAHSPKRQPWTKTDKELFAVAYIANAYDFHTTKYGLDKGGKIMEPWPTLLYFGDETPSTELLALSKAAQLGIAWTVLDRIESKWRKLILFLMTGTWVYYGVSNSH